MTGSREDILIPGVFLGKGIFGMVRKPPNHCSSCQGGQEDRQKDDTDDVGLAIHIVLITRTSFIQNLNL